jgi:hexokinase
MFEKRVSGMFLGEILRRALLSLLSDSSVPLFADEHSNQNDVHSTTNVASDSPLYQTWGIDTSFLSITSGDNSAGLKVTRQTLDKDYGVSAASAEDAEAVRLIASAIGKRAARLSAVAMAAIVIATNKLQHPTEIATTNDASLEVNEDDIVDIGVDGSLVEFYPRFEEYIREALREIPEIGPQGEKRIRIGIAKDGSGVGAALIALVADKAVKGGESIHVVPRGDERCATDKSLGKWDTSGSSAVSSSGGIAGFLSNIIGNINRTVRIRV